MSTNESSWMIEIDDLEGRELDTAVAEALGEVPCLAWDDLTIFPPSSIKMGECSHERCYPAGRGPARYSAEAFTEVKREIERRGWEWHSCVKQYEEIGLRYWFSIYAGPCMVEESGSPENPPLVRLFRHEGLADSVAASEELAGCRAFLKAAQWA